LIALILITTTLMTLILAVKDAPVEEITQLPSGLPRNQRRRLKSIARRISQPNSFRAGCPRSRAFRDLGWGLKPSQQTRQLHFITFGYYHRDRLPGTEQARNTFVSALGRVRMLWLLRGRHVV